LSGLFRCPEQLELQFLLVATPLVLDVEDGACGNVQPFAGDLDGKRSLRLDCVGQPAELGNELGAALGPGEIAVCHELFLETMRLGQRRLKPVRRKNR